MGLDMYLYASRSAYDFGERKEEYKELESFVHSQMMGSVLPRDPNVFESIEVTVNVAYWRKANAIHHWFVDHVQGGVDECQLSYVGDEELERLISVSGKVVNILEPYFRDVGEYDEVSIPEEVVDEVMELLPTSDGFFFGSTEIGPWYYDDIVYTHNRLREVLDWVKSERSDDRYWDIRYQASW